MAIHGSEVDSVGTTTGMEGCKTAFVDTSLNTQLAMAASYMDTVSDFKNKLVLQHMHWFPEIGEIKIHSLKVKRRGKFYHLSDILLVRNVFNGVKGSWYLTADASRTSTCHLNQISSGPYSSEGLKTDVTDKSCDVNNGVLPLDVNGGPSAIISSPDVSTEKNVVSEITNGLKVEMSSKEDANFQRNSSSGDSEIHAEKCKISRKENVCHNPVLKDIVSKDADRGNVMVDAVEAAESIRNNQFDVNNVEGTSDKRKMDTMLENVVLDNSIVGKKSENEFGNSIRTNNLECVSVKEPNLSAGSVDNNGALHNAKSESKKRKKSKKTAAKIQNLSDLEVETRKGESIQEPYMAGAAKKSYLLESDKEKKDIVLENTIPESFMAGKSENELGQNDQANHSESPSTKELNLSAISNGDAKQDADTDGRKKRKKNKKGETVEKTLVPAAEENMVGNSQNLLASYEMKDNTVLDSGIPTGKSEGITVKDSNVFVQEAKSEGKKRNKSKKKGAEMSQMEHAIREGESNEPYFETVNTIEQEDEGNLSLNHDEKDMLSSQSKTLDCIDQGLTRKETNSLLDLSEANVVMENKISDGTGKKKKKRREKKSAGINLEKPALEQTNNGVNASSVLLSFDISEEVQIKQSDASVANKELPIANENEANIVISQIVQFLENDSTKENKMENDGQSFNTPDANFPVLVKENEIVESNQAEKNNEEGKKSKKKRKKSKVSASDVQENFPVKEQTISAEIPVTEDYFPTKGAIIASSAANKKLPNANENESNIVISQSEQTLEDDGAKKKKMGNDADFPVLVKENEILESSQAEKYNKDTGDEVKKSKKKRKKSQVTASDVQENIPIKDKKISAEKHVTAENLPIKVAHNIASTQVIPDKSEENLKMLHGPAVVNDAKEINFRQHFVHDQNQCKVASGDNIKGASQLNGEKETGKNVKNDELSSIRPSTELQNLLKSSVKQDNEYKSSLKSARGMRSGDSTLNSQNLVKDSNQMVAASSYSGKKNTSSSKTSSERSEALPSNRQDTKRVPVLNDKSKTVMKTPQAKSLFLKSGAFSQDNSKNSATNTMMLMKTPQRLNLLTKPGSIFQDNSVEDSLGDNGNVDSDASTHNSSDSSSESGDSDGESEISHNSNGANDGKGISNGGMLDNFSMSKILRSSEQFKKAKLIASQSEVEQEELFLDSQPNP